MLIDPRAEALAARMFQGIFVKSTEVEDNVIMLNEEVCDSIAQYCLRAATIFYDRANIEAANAGPRH